MGTAITPPTMQRSNSGALAPWFDEVLAVHFTRFFHVEQTDVGDAPDRRALGHAVTLKAAAE